MNVKTLRKAKHLLGEAVKVSGWVRTLRKQKNIAFIELNDGSSVKSMQIIAPPSAIPVNLTVGSSLEVHGDLCQGIGKHADEMEVHAQQDHQLHVIGSVESSYPFQKKYQSLEFLREHLHLRSRTNTASAVLRTRHHISLAVRDYLNKAEFIEVQTPIITSNDCEGAGELFSVTLPRQDVGKGNTAATDGAPTFFDKPAYLTVSGQIHAEALASSMGRVYTFGPTFRAENSNTSRHLCEFWMIEPEMAFANMDDAIDIATGTLQHTFTHVLEQCPEEMDFFGQQSKGNGNQGNQGNQGNSGNNNATPTPRKIIEQASQHTAFARMTYTEAVKALSNSSLTSAPPTWGMDLNSEQERWLVEQHCDYQPLVVTDYPTSIKPFYMRRNDCDNGNTVAAFDVLFPGVGEIVGGSGREERVDMLEHAMKERQINWQDGLDWYVDLRRHGTVPHAGFGIGFERLLMACTGVKNVRDCIPFPRTPGSCPA
jgi:asparaginyl-tRNA synthetase